MAYIKTEIKIMRPGAESEFRMVAIDLARGYHAIKEIVRPLLDGGELERVLVYVGDRPFLGDGAYRDMFIDDEGAPELTFVTNVFGGDNPGKNLPVNKEATTHYHHNMMMHNPPAYPCQKPMIYGPAVLFTNIRVWK